MKQSKNIFLLCIVIGLCSFYQGSIRRIIIKEYAGGTILPTRKRNEIIQQELFDGRFIKVNLYDYRGKMYLWCYSKDSILLEEGNYINSLSLLKTQKTAIASGSAQNRVIVIEYYEPLRDGKWYFYDTTGKLLDSSFYNNGISVPQ